MPMPIDSSCHYGFDELVDPLAAPALEDQAAQLLLLGRNQVQPAGILRDEQYRDLEPSDQRRLGLPREMRAQIIRDQHPLRRGIGLQHLLQELNEARTVQS
jgi:hypothetical protein